MEATCKHGPKRGEVMGDRRKLHNEELLHKFYISPNIIRVIKSRKIRWSRHVARTGKNRNAYRILVVQTKERDHQEDENIGGWTI
jgi:hypothetical protein